MAGGTVPLTGVTQSRQQWHSRELTLWRLRLVSLNSTPPPKSSALPASWGVITAPRLYHHLCTPCSGPLRTLGCPQPPPARTSAPVPPVVEAGSTPPLPAPSSAHLCHHPACHRAILPSLLLGSRHSSPPGSAGGLLLTSRGTPNFLLVHTSETTPRRGGNCGSTSSRAAPGQSEHPDPVPLEGRPGLWH